MKKCNHTQKAKKLWSYKIIETVASKGLSEARALSKTRKIKQFTLVEVLTVVGIIAMLAAILLPTLGIAREEARKAYCLNNLKQTGLSLVSYSDDFEGQAPPFMYNNNHLSHADYAFMNNRWDGLGILWQNKYVKDAASLYCVSNDFTNYIYNKANFIEFPAGQTIMTSYIYRDPNSPEWAGQVTWSKTKDIWRSENAALIADAFGSKENYNAHKNGMNIIFGDGHAKWGQVSDKDQLQEVENINTHNECSNASMINGWLPLDTL